MLCLAGFVSGCSNEDGELFGLTVIEHPLVIINSFMRAEAAERAGLDPEPLWGTHSDEELTELLEAAFDDDIGNELFKLKLAITPAATMFALERGDGDTSSIVSPHWLGQIDVALHSAMKQTNFQPTNPHDLQGVGDVAAQGLLPLLAQSYGFDVDDPVIDKIRIELNELDFAVAAAETLNNGGSRVIYTFFQMTQVIWQRGHIDLAPGLTPAEGILPREPSDQIVVHDKTGATITKNEPNGGNVTLQDWERWLAIEIWYSQWPSLPTR